MATDCDIGQLITRDPHFRDGKPCIAGTGVSVRRVIGLYQMGVSPEEIALDFGHISLAQVHAAITYYFANQQQMDKEIRAEEEEEERLYLEHRKSKDQRP
jgi:uncharacterized protein (DUF433 family)